MNGRYLLRQVGMSAVAGGRGKMQMSRHDPWPINDMSAMTETQLPMLVSFPVTTFGARPRWPAYVCQNRSAQQVLSVIHDPEKSGWESNLAVIIQRSADPRALQTVAS